jgi:3-dehydroquinate synthase
MPRRVQLGSDFSDVYQGNGCRHALFKRVFQEAPRAVVISDRQVQQALGSRLDIGDEWLLVPAGESSKCLPSAAELWSWLCRVGVDRDTAVLAVGGGMVLDLAGFVAATYLRGLPLYSLPTSLLAMVDASVGGKVGIDLPEGKNLVGQFYPARAVAIDPELLDSLPETEWSAGMAEVIKHGILQGSPLWELLATTDRSQLERPEQREHLLREAVEVKLRVVSQDPYERTGLRATLNLGHTFGHAFEWSSNYRLRHGEAVALGLLAAVRLSRLLGLLEEDFEPDLIRLLRRWSLPTSLPDPDSGPWSWDSLVSAFSRDKKSSGGQWNFLCPVRAGQVLRVSGPDPELVRAAVDSLRSEPLPS